MYSPESSIKAQSNEGTAKFGVENSAARQETTLTVDNQLDMDDGGIKAIEGYFDKLTAAVVN